MTSLWPNAEIAELKESTKGQTTLSAEARSKVVNALLAHAQLLIVIGLMQLTSIFVQLAVLANDFIDKENFEATFQQATFWGNLNLGLALAVFVSSIWLLLTCGGFSSSKFVKEHRRFFWPQGAAGILFYIGLGGLLALYLGGLGYLFWHTRADQMPSGMFKIAMMALQLICPCLMFIGAVFRIRQSMKLAMEGKS